MRSKGVSLATSSNWAWNFALAHSTPYLVDEDKDKADLGTSVFYIWSGFCALGFIFVYFNIHETMNLSLEKVSETYKQVPAWKSVAWNKEHTKPRNDAEADVSLELEKVVVDVNRFSVGSQDS